MASTIRGVQNAMSQRVPKKLDLRRNTSKHIIIKLPKIKDKERMLNAARAKERVTYKEVPIRLSADFSKEIKFPGGLVVSWARRCV